MLAWLNYMDRSFLVPMALTACAAHEVGHVLTIYLLRGGIKQFRLTATGAELVLDRPLGYWQEGLSALAGPGVNLLLALICCCFAEGLAFAGLNFVLALFNLLPAGRLDGGRALHCTLALLFGPELADWTGVRLDLLCTAAALAGGVLLAGSGNITLLLVAFWLAAACLGKSFA